MSSLSALIVGAFRTRFGAAPALVARAPGRVNLIGEHTDYNDGFVMPLALEQAVWLAARPRSDRRVVLHSLDVDEPAAFDLDDAEHEAGWAEYPKGVAWALGEAGHDLAGFEGVLTSDVPRGAGLSSSAALELAVARAFAAVSGIDWDGRAMALAGQRAENGWVGVNCGVMDQMASALGEPDHAILLDCRSLATTPVPLPAGTVALVLDTGTRRGLVDSAYNERRAACERAAEALGVPALRDVAPERLAEAEGRLDATALRRARHVVTENARVLEAAEAMRAGDPVRLGALMDQSHASLRDDYEVSSDALDAFVEAARAQPGCHGARMTGAGFGGCAVALVDADRADTVAEAAAATYRRQTGHTPATLVAHASRGASLEPLPTPP
ncbi:galactokinase [Rubrivirga marina]|uniref:Galactokinase n=1 Tax=Rubrivirga marina TaxID=1196024 RepID=A0A271IYG7_9BACT|nr:galactokinase [Rubrivirga marina]PAP76008.1 galactokinase [Rubrivirga marina]